MRARWAALREGRVITDAARPLHCDTEFASDLQLPVANYWLTARLSDHDEVLAIWPGSLEPIVRAAAASGLLVWMDGDACDAYVIADVAGLASSLARLHVDPEAKRVRDRLVWFFGVAADAGVDVRVTRE